ncbi:nucleolar protein 11-like [Argiope bruennichi]|uniref:Nucleolar protein 11 like protein n=1 Tax=Argiope bruennichi TaxID=94029 RepID=A0A8T0E663_ARGBR|nr:nucleolar protein 11-like [Argiope bruennichi]KAF8766766.1 Nucleolar protein 11 like protein [Argiope bruennichi]
MAKFDEECSYNCVSIKNFFRLPIVFKEENCFLINEGNRCIVKVSDRKLLQSWRLKHPHYFTAPVVFDNENELMYCVIENNTALRWPYSTADDDVLKIASKFKFQEAIFGVIPVLGHKPLILFASGKALKGEELDFQSAPKGNRFITENENLIWADSLKLNSGAMIVCISQKNEDYRLHYFAITEKKIKRGQNHPLVQKGASLKNWCLNRSMCSFVTIWSNGVILSYNLDTKEETTLLTLTDIDNHLLAIDFMDSNHLAIMKFDPKNKGACLEMWDLKFKILKARKALKNIESPDVKLSVIGSSVFFSNGEDLVEVSYHVEKSTLASGLGKGFAAVPVVQEFSWNTKNCTDLCNSEKDTEEIMDVSENEQTILDSTELIAQRLMEEGSMSLNYISEAELVRLLRLAIRYKFKKKETEENITIEPDLILNTVFSTSFSEVFLVKSLKKLNLEDAMMALNILSSFLLDEESLSIKDKQKPSDLQLFSWMFLIIQSHMEALLLSKDKKALKLFRKLQKCISEKLQDCEDVENIQYLLHLIQKKKNILPEKYVTGKYCIETLDT